MSLVKLGDIARECRSTYSGNKSGIPIVGLEHLTPGDIVLYSWDIDTDNTFSKSFKKGQVLLGRRRVYLKKASVAPFDGICSGDITVIEAIPEKLHPDLLPFIIQNDRFFEFAIIGSAGSLSPRVKWEYLKEYEINLPELNQQGKLVELLTSANELKHSYQEMILATDEMVKSQFIEMFGKTKQASIGSLFDTTSGGTPSRTKSSYFDGGNIPWLTSSEVGQGLINKTESFITEEGLKNSSAKWIPANSVVVAMYGATVGKVGLLEIPCTTNQAVCSILPNDSIIPMFLLYAVKDKEEWMIDQAAGAAQPNISQAVIRKMEIPVPTKDEQIAFVEIAKQADKSKYLN